MQPYDVFMIVVLAAATLFGAWKGMAWQVASTASLVVSYLVALKFSERLAPHFGQQAPLNRFIAMFVLYMATSLAIWLLFRIVAGFINRVRLREFDRQMGALFGAAKGVLWCVAITFFAVTLSERARSAVLDSRSGYMIARLLDRADGLMPRELHGVLEPYLDKFEQELNRQEEPTATAALTRPARLGQSGRGAAHRAARSGRCLSVVRSAIEQPRTWQMPALVGARHRSELRSGPRNRGPKRT